MNIILRRIGLVFWWLGALTVGVLAVSVMHLLATIMRQRFEEDYFERVMLLTIPIAVCWAISYILAGSFWRPPRID